MAAAHDIWPAINDLANLPLGELKRLYEQLLGSAPRIDHRRFLVRRVAWQIQAQRYGGLSEAASARLAELTKLLNPLAEMIARGKSRRAATNARSAKATSSAEFGSSTSPAKLAPPKRHRLGRDARLPMPGSVLRRVYQGREILVRVLAGGFEFDGKTYRSLSAIAKEVTGAHWNGMLFFGLITQQKTGKSIKESA